jgi:hypothetical protein
MPPGDSDRRSRRPAGGGRHGGPRSRRQRGEWNHRRSDRPATHLGRDRLPDGQQIRAKRSHCVALDRRARVRTGVRRPPATTVAHVPMPRRPDRPPHVWLGEFAARELEIPCRPAIRLFISQNRAGPFAFSASGLPFSAENLKNTTAKADTRQHLSDSVGRRQGGWPAALQRPPLCKHFTPQLAAAPLPPASPQRRLRRC